MMTLSKKRTITLLGVAMTLVTANALAYTGQNLASEAKVSIEQARAIALKAYPGQITDGELEKEKGGSKLRYSFDIEHNKVAHEVGIDAETGKVLENSLEGPNAD